MRENYLTKAWPELPKIEGFSADLKGDTGGKTWLGITNKWFPKVYFACMEKVKAGDIDEALLIAQNFYFNNFWIPLSCDNLSYPEDVDAFLEAVNFGEGTVLGMLKQCSNAEDFMQKCEARHQAIAASNPQEAQFLKGWLNRDKLIEMCFGHGA
jgi:lysozyme family protein